jgi:D-alanine-D-alanine ligase
MEKLRVGVVFGGRSVEHEVSIVTAHQMMEALVERHDVTPIYVTREGRWLTSPALNDLEVYRQKRWDDVGEPALVSPSADGGGVVVPGGRLRGPRSIALDVVVPAIHGTFGEDGTLQGLLELADIPYTGSGVAASAIGMDKAAMKAVFRAAGLPVVPDVLVQSSRVAADASAAAAEVEQGLDYPLFVKPVRAGSSVGIAGAKDRESLIAALEVARRYDRRILVEKAMQGCIEVNCSVLGGGRSPARASVCEQPVAWEEFLSFDDKYMRGGKSSKTEGMASLDRRIPAPISDELTKQVQENALAAFAVIDAAGVARVDSFVDTSSGETWVMEINTTPGSFAFYLWEASGLPFTELADELLNIALQVHEEKSELLFSFESGMLDKTKGGQKGGG